MKKQLRRLLSLTMAVGLAGAVATSASACLLYTSNPYDPRDKASVRPGTLFREDNMDLPFRAMAECTEEAVLNSMVCAGTVTGYNGTVVSSLTSLWAP